MNPPRTQVVLWRHGVTDWNTAGRFQGRSDQPLNEAGRAQAERAARSLAALAPDAIVSSPLVRALATAQPLAVRTGLPVRTDPRLMEMNVGSWEGLYWHEVVELDPGFEAAIAAGLDWRRSPSGETGIETGARVGACITELAGQFSGRTVVVVSHGLAIRMAVARLLGWDYRTATTLASMQNCAWATLTVRDSGEWKLLTWNQAPQE